MSVLTKLQNSREMFLFDGSMNLKPPMLDVDGLKVAIEMTRHVPDGITPHDFFMTAGKEEILTVYDAAIMTEQQRMDAR